MSPFLKSIEALRLDERERDMAAKRGCELAIATREYAETGADRAARAEAAQLRGQVRAKRDADVTRLRSEGLTQLEVSERLNLSWRQVQETERRLRRLSVAEAR